MLFIIVTFSVIISVVIDIYSRFNTNKTWTCTKTCGHLISKFWHAGRSGTTLYAMQTQTWWRYERRIRIGTRRLYLVHPGRLVSDYFWVPMESRQIHVLMLFVALVFFICAIAFGSNLLLVSVAGVDHCCRCSCICTCRSMG